MVCPEVEIDLERKRMRITPVKACDRETVHVNAGLLRGLKGARYVSLFERAGSFAQMWLLRLLDGVVQPVSADGMLRWLRAGSNRGAYSLNNSRRDPA
jgi:hypothetical protein